MNLYFPTRESYLLEQRKLNRMGVKELEDLLGYLYERRYVDQDISYESYYRLTSHVYVQKTRKDQSLIFHLKNFLGIVVGLIIIS